MGCYGLGIPRTMASVVEQSNDEKGIIWPMSIAPWQVHLCALRVDNPEASLRDLGQLMSEPISRSGVNHRLAKIVSYADKLKAGE